MTTGSSGHATLTAERVIEPLSEGRADARLWVDCEIASCVENRFFEKLDPRSLQSEDRERWQERVLAEGKFFEALDREEGFIVRTPRIPGLLYRDFGAIS